MSTRAGRFGEVCCRMQFAGGGARATPAKQMRSGPATRTALFWRNVLLPFHALGVEELTAGVHSEEHSPVMPPGRPSWRSKLRHSICGTTVAGSKSRRVWRTL